MGVGERAGKSEREIERAGRERAGESGVERESGREGAG